MHTQNDLPVLDAIDPELTERLVTRREAIAKGAAVSGTVCAFPTAGSPNCWRGIPTITSPVASTSVTQRASAPLVVTFPTTSWFKTGIAGSGGSPIGLAVAVRV